MLSKPVAVPKGRPKMLDTDARKAKIADLDKRETLKVITRAAGRCEAFIVTEGRCKRRQFHVHHLLGGIGRRGIGNSALAEHKIGLCEQCHREIHGHVLKRLQDGDTARFDDAYERVR